MTAQPPLTVRVDGNDLIVSTDDGRTARIDLTRYPELRDILSDLRRRVSQSQGLGNEPSAAALAAIGESAELRPRGDVPPPAHPLAAAMTSGARVPLGPRIEGAPEMPLREVLGRRRSSRRLGPLSLDDLAPLLVRAGRTRAVVGISGGGQLESRPYPSAGARHPIELVVAARGIDELDDGWWWFEPFTCQLAQVALYPASERALALVRDVAAIEQPLAAAVFAIASFPRTLSRYPAGSTLVWRDAGAALVTVHLAATELGLASCIVGTSGIVRTVGNALAIDVGAVAVGQRRGDGS